METNEVKQKSEHKATKPLCWVCTTLHAIEKEGGVWKCRRCLEQRCWVCGFRGGIEDSDVNGLWWCWDCAKIDPKMKGHAKFALDAAYQAVEKEIAKKYPHTAAEIFE